MLILHVVAALLLLGPVTVAVSTFHVRAREAHNGNNLARGSVRTLCTITNTYGLICLIVPLLGVGLRYRVGNPVFSDRPTSEEDDGSVGVVR